MKLNYGCGMRVLPDYINVDVRGNPGVDVVIDDSKPLPFRDSSVDYIFCDNVLEHVKDLGFVLGEFFRVCKDGALIEVIVPFFGRSQFEYHNRTFRYNCFCCHEVNGGSVENNPYPKYFRTVKRRLRFPKRWKWLESFFNRHHRVYENSPLRIMFIASSIYVLLEVVKD